MSQSLTINHELILINPNHSNLILRFILRIFGKAQLNLSLLTLKALTPPSYHVTIHNQRFFWGKNHFKPGALIGITCFTATSQNAYLLADRFRKAGAYVVLGGPHASALPDEALLHAHSVVIGEAESVWNEVLADFENHTLKKKYIGQPLEDFFSRAFDGFLKMPARALWGAGICSSRGCKYRCDFCTIQNKKPRAIDTKYIIALITHMKNASPKFLLKQKTLVFRDDNIFNNPEQAKELFRCLAPLKIKWAANASLDIAFDDEALRLAKESGCKSLFIGFETLNLNYTPKISRHHLKTYHDLLKAIQNIRTHNIKIIGAFILGFDHMRHKDFFQLLTFLIKARLWLVSLTILTPFPGSALFERLKNEKRVLTYDWNKYDLLWHVVFKPARMSAFALWLWFIILRTVTIFISPLTLLLIFNNSIIFFFTYQITHQIILLILR